MPIPESPRVVFEQNPLAEVGCQFTIPTIFRLEEEAPVALQEACRKAEFSYPYVNRQYARVEDRPEPLPVYEFISEDRLWKFSICSEFLQLTTTDYHERKTFHPKLEPLTDSFAEIYERNRILGFVLYYRDVIDREALGLGGAAWRDLLNPAFAGELCDEHLRVEELLGMERKMTLDLPGDLGTVELVHGLRELDDGRRVYVMDSYLRDEREATFSEAIERLHDYHDRGGALFRWAISETLIEALGVDDEV